MQTQNANLIRGLGIASIVLASIMLLCVLLAAAMVGVGGALLGSASEWMMEDIAYGGGNYYYYDESFDVGMDVVGGIVIAILAFVLIWEALTCAVSIAAGVYGMKAAKDPSLMGKVFGWSIAGAVAALLGGRFIALAVHVVSAVFAQRDRNEFTMREFQPAPAYGQPTYAQPVAQPQQVYGQPVAQPVAQPQQAYVQPQPVAQPQSVAQPQPVAQPQSVVEPAVEPIVEVAPEPVVEVVVAAEPAVEIVVEPVVEAAAEPVIEPAAEPAAQPKADAFPKGKVGWKAAGTAGK